MRRHYLLALLLLVHPGTGDAQSLSEERLLTLGSSFVQAFYPKLQRGNSQIQISFSVAMDSAGAPEAAGRIVWDGPPPRSNADQLQSTLLLHGGLWLDRSGFITQYDAGGEAVNALRYALFLEQLSGHPKWSKARIAGAQRAAGARYGPGDRDAFLKTVPFKRLESLIGPFVVQEVRFGGAWTIYLHVQRPGRPPARYFLGFDPLGGMLNQIGELPEIRK